MPERKTERDHRWDLDRIRAALIGDTAGIDIEVDGLSARVSDVPLFRRTDDGRMVQAVRVWARAETEEEAITWTISSGDGVIDRVIAPAGPSPTSHYLMVPEVEAPETFRLEATRATRSPIQVDITVAPQRKWSIYLIHHSHLDIGYTDPQATVLASQLAYLDAALDLVMATDDWPEESRFRWNVEVTWRLPHWQGSRPASICDAFIERVKQGRIEINALSFSMHTEAYSLDELARQLWVADELRERHGVEITSAMQTDVPGATVGLATLLTDAGVRYLSVAHNYAGRSVPHLVGGQALRRPFYWAAPDGERLLVWYTDTPHGVAYMEGNLVGLATDYGTTLASLPEYLNALAQRPYPYGKEAFGWAGIPAGVEVTKEPYPHDILHLRVQSVIADNAAPSLVPASIAREWNAAWAYPKLRIATNQEFFAAVEERLGDRLDTYAGDWTDWWADGIGSGARALGYNRAAQGAIRAAQTLHALADVTTNDARPESSTGVDRAYEDMALFDEHTWGAANPWEDGLSQMASGGLQWGRKAAFAYEAHDRTNAALEAGLHRFAAIGSSTGALASLIVFNPSSWARTDLVRVFIPEHRTGGEAHFIVVETDSQAAVAHVREEQGNASHRPRGSWLTFLARDIPPVGYARYDLVASGEPVGAGELTTSTGTPMVLDNEYLRIELDAFEGCVGSLMAKATRREVVDGSAPHGFNQYIYDRYTSAPGFNHLSSSITAGDLSLLGSRSTGGYGVVTERSSNAVWDRVTLRLSGEGADWIETTYTLPRGIPRLDITNRLHKIATPQKESVYFAFPFAAANPSFASEITGGVARADGPRVPGSAHHFRAIRHWVAMEDQAGPSIAWATLEAPLVQFGNIHLPYAPFPETIPSADARVGTIYSWALNNIWDTNFPPQQGGEMTFRYAVSVDDAIGARQLGGRAGASVAAPLLGVCCPTNPTAPDLPARGSYCSVDDHDVQVTHLAPSRRGHDLVVFLASNAAESREVRLSFGLLPVARAWVGTFLERSPREVAVVDNAAQIEVEAGGYVTVALDLVDR
ncbi:MAG: Alpha-mannosidase [uncultured Thermomicrobiales bacterium]|uniref:Alpha-mannosidase n=1 Tax=uncultured Thermomicrobiales bacterium TaxID=1645740 RepID=A0A6J4V7L8_9BACT|nr:MAG: Alpha-mannosidase [uncultured Thermomicrobiales bacterium]